MTISPFEHAFAGLLTLAIGVILIDFVRASMRRGYVYGLWWDFQRGTQPVRFWLYIALVLTAAVAQFWSALGHGAKLLGLL